MKNEQSSITFRVPDFIDADGIVHRHEVIVEMDGDIRDKTLERPLTERKRRPRSGKSLAARPYWRSSRSVILRRRSRTCSMFSGSD
jgi:hypothetical protein